MGINFVNVQVWGRSQQDVITQVRQEFGRFIRGDEHTRKKHLGFSVEDHAQMLAFQKQAQEWVGALGERAAFAADVATAVGPKLGGWVGVYDAAMEAQNGKHCEAAARRLSQKLETAVLTLVVREGRSFLYVLGSNGVSLDWYMAGPDFGPTAPPPVHAEALGRALGDFSLTERITAALAGSELTGPERTGPGFSGPEPEPDLLGLMRRGVNGTGAGARSGADAPGYERLMALAQALDIHNAGLGYRGLAIAGPERAERWPDFKFIKGSDYSDLLA